jgi:hypothetical protein
MITCFFLTSAVHLAHFAIVPDLATKKQLREGEEQARFVESRINSARGDGTQKKVGP